MLIWSVIGYSNFSAVPFIVILLKDFLIMIKSERVTHSECVTTQDCVYMSWHEGLLVHQPAVVLEPTTLRLRVLRSRSTDWAKQAVY